MDRQVNANEVCSAVLDSLHTLEYSHITAYKQCIAVV